MTSDKVYSYFLFLEQKTVILLDLRFSRHWMWTVLGCNMRYFWDSLRFWRNIYCLHLQGQSVSQARNQQKQAARLSLPSVTCLSHIKIFDVTQLICNHPVYWLQLWNKQLLYGLLNLTQHILRPRCEFANQVFNCKCHASDHEYAAEPLP
jgi:hypothetical protein